MYSSDIPYYDSDDACPQNKFMASRQQLVYLYSLAENQGLDAEQLSMNAFGKDLPDLLEGEATYLIATLKI